jgi:hypothetical protein
MVDNEANLSHGSPAAHDKSNFPEPDRSQPGSSDDSEDISGFDPI